MTVDDDVWSRRRVAFADQAGAYAVGRPSYPAEALRWVVGDRPRRVLDLGAGTGRLTAALLALGHDVVAVEPLAEMRAHVPAGADTRAGSAEEIPLDDASVDAVVVGQAFHWFDRDRAVGEIARVLRPGGTVGLLWNLLDDTDPWVARFADAADADERASIMTGDTPPYDDGAGLERPQRRVFHHAEPFDADRLEAYVLSRSSTILLPADERDRIVTAVRRLAPDGGVRLPMVCEVWRGERTRLLS